VRSGQQRVARSGGAAMSAAVELLSRLRLGPVPLEMVEPNRSRIGPWRRGHPLGGHALGR